jgi:hypothetical protein
MDIISLYKKALLTVIGSELLQAPRSFGKPQKTCSFRTHVNAPKSHNIPMVMVTFCDAIIQ